MVGEILGASVMSCQMILLGVRTVRFSLLTKHLGPEGRKALWLVGRFASEIALRMVLEQLARPMGGGLGPAGTGVNWELTGS